MSFSFYIDRGGTFADVYCISPFSPRPIVLKLLSEDPAYTSAPLEAIRRILQSETGAPLPTPLPTSGTCPRGPWRVAEIRMSTTVATNALLERKGARTALLVTAGFRDVLHIGTQARPSLFDITVARPSPLYEEVVEVDERLILRDAAHPTAGAATLVGSSGETYEVETAPSEQAVRGEVARLLRLGITSFAVAFLHSASAPHHEKLVERWIRAEGAKNVTLSSTAMPTIKLVPRGYTALADAYLTPPLRDVYIAGFVSGFADGLVNTRLSFMQSDGGLAPLSSFSGRRAVLSGPAGGVVGVAATAGGQGGSGGVVAFDMGGTSTDVSRWAGAYEFVNECTIAGVVLAAPQLDISTVAAGGGSICTFRHGTFCVGPESAGSSPGPVCYGRNGPLTVTDANLVLGRLQPQFFPHIFGPEKNGPLQVDAAVSAFTDLCRLVNAHAAQHGLPSKTLDEVAAGFVQVANEAMCRPIRAIPQMCVCLGRGGRASASAFFFTNPSPPPPLLQGLPKCTCHA